MDAQNYMKLCKNSPSLRRYRPPSRPQNLLNAVPPTLRTAISYSPKFFGSLLGQNTAQAPTESNL